MVTEVTKGIYSIDVPLPNNPLKNLNAYLIRGERNLLVDTGFHQDASRNALLAGLREIGVSMDDTDIFLTHLHSDHTGLAPELRGNSTKIYIGTKDLPFMPGKNSSFHWADSDERYAAEGFPRDLLAVLTERNPAQGLSPIPYDDYIPVVHGQRFSYGNHSFQALCTPGHTPGHMVLWEAETGICLLGDHVLFDITPNISRWEGVTDSLGDYLNSLQEIKQLPVTLALPAHRAVHGDFAQRCEQLIRHHEVRCREVLRILQGSSPQTAWEIAAQMQWRIKARDWSEFPTPQKWFAVGEAMAHLDHLIAQGAVSRSLEQDFYRYQLAHGKGQSNS